MFKGESEKGKGICEVLGVKREMEGRLRLTLCLAAGFYFFSPLYFPVFRYEEQLIMIDGLSSGVGMA